MAQITNISSSADYQSMRQTTSPSEDEDDTDGHQHFLTPSSEIDLSTRMDVVPSHLILNIDHHDTDSINTADDLSQVTPITNPSLHTYLNLSTSSSESSLVRPLLPEKHRTLPIYTSNIINSEDLVPKSFVSPADSTLTHPRSFLKLYVTDMMISAFIITPLVNIHWRGAWDLLDLYLLPNYERTSAVVSLALGLCLLHLIYLTQNVLQLFYEKHQQDFLGQFLNRFYTLIIAFAYINQWRGLWNLFDFTSNAWYFLLIETLVSIVCLLLIKSIYNLNSAPFLIGTDTECYFLIGSKYQVSNNRFCQYTFDFFFYEIIEAPLVVIAWRGLYNLSDLYIYPENKIWSMAISFLIGYLLFFLLGLIQIPVLKCFLKRRYESFYGTITNLFHLIAFVSVVQIWRSLWMLCEQYIDIPDYHLLTLWLCYVGAYVVLTCGLAACSLNGPGGAKDGYDDAQPMLLFKFEYMSTLLKSQLGRTVKNKGRRLVSDSSSTETIVTNERPYRFEPP